MKDVIEYKITYEQLETIIKEYYRENEGVEEVYTAVYEDGIGVNRVSKVGSVNLPGEEKLSFDELGEILSSLLNVEVTKIEKENNGYSPSTKLILTCKSKDKKK